MEDLLHKEWRNILENFITKQTWKKLKSFVEQEYESKTIYPKKSDIFNALNQMVFDDISVIIIGQDPYHGPGEAHGLSFSVPEEIKLPPSLRNIYKEIESDTGIKKDFTNGNLNHWVNQGVLLLNSVLTVRESNADSHKNKGWEMFTNEIIQKISDNKEHCVFLLWGKKAQKKGQHIDRTKHLVLESPHPSPFSAYRGFFGNKHFSKTNQYLKQHHKPEISW